jgi:SNW domain-containing protein 1
LERTKGAILERVEKKCGTGQVNAPIVGSAPEYIKYTPSKQSVQYNSGASHRLIKMHAVQYDPLEPPKFRHKKVGDMAPSWQHLSFSLSFVPRQYSDLNVFSPKTVLQVPQGPGSSPVPVVHSPPRSITAKDQADWKIPPSISNWKVCLLRLSSRRLR